MYNDVYFKYLNYIETNFSDKDTWISNIKNITNLNLYIQKEEIEENFVYENFETFVDLMNTSNKLNFNIEFIVIALMLNKSTISIVKLCEIENVRNLIKIYCLINELDYSEVIKGINSNNINSENLDDYMKQIRKFPVLSKEEELALAKKAASGDVLAKEKLINSNLGIVVKLAKMYSKNSHDFLDLIQEGNLALIKSVENFDYQKDCRLAVFGYSRIKNSISSAYKEKLKRVKIPLAKYHSYYKLECFKEQFFFEYGFYPNLDQIIKGTGFSEKVVEDLMVYPSEILSVEEIKEQRLKEIEGSKVEVNQIESFDEIDLTVNLEEIEENIYNENIVNEILDNYKEIGLDEREISTIKFRFGFVSNRIYSISEVAKMYNVSKTRIQQIERRALEKIRDYFTNKSQQKKLVKKRKFI